MLRASFIVSALAALSSGCLRQTSFHCETSDQCGAGGTCESEGFCSLPDPSCPSGDRFTDAAGALANQCVGGDPGSDGGIDAPPGDGAPGDGAPVDGPAAGCPAGYAEITGGQAGHRYRLLTAAANWQTQRDTCAATSASAYLAHPEDAAELAALGTLAASTFWVGISDMGTEGTFVTLQGGAPPSSLWLPGEPDGGQQVDCVAAMMSGGNYGFADERCNQQYAAICECVP